MKKIIVISVVLLCSLKTILAQNVVVTEPVFVEETLLLISDTEGVKLTRENGIIKTKTGASFYLTGIGKIKSRLTLEGKESVSKATGKTNMRLIIKASDNNTDPNSFINIFKFEIKGKERRYQLSETGTLSPTKSNNLANVDYNAQKYGESSYLLELEGLTPGEYGILLGDPNSENTKNILKVTTFSVK